MPKTSSFFLLLVLVFRLSESRPPFACDPANVMTKNLPFCKVSLPITNRVNDLIGRLTLQEKIRLLVNNAAPVERLGINGYEWWSEALHGVSNTGPGVRFGGEYPGATSFPQVITTAASFNDSLWQAIGQVCHDIFQFLRLNLQSKTLCSLFFVFVFVVVFFTLCLMGFVNIRLHNLTRVTLFFLSEADIP